MPLFYNLNIPVVGIAGINPDMLKNAMYNSLNRVSLSYIVVSLYAGEASYLKLYPTGLKEQMNFEVKKTKNLKVKSI